MEEVDVDESCSSNNDNGKRDGDLLLPGHWTLRHDFDSTNLSADHFNPLPSDIASQRAFASTIDDAASAAVGMGDWDIVAVTARVQAHAIAFAKELESYPELSGCPLIIPVSDLTFEVSMGSGGASLQALGRRG